VFDECPGSRCSTSRLHAGTSLSRLVSRIVAGKHTFFGKTATMLQGDTEIGHLQKILLKIMFVLVVLSCALCFTALGYLLGERDQEVKKALSFTVVLLVASIPIAIEIVCTTTLALGSRMLSSHGAIVTRLAAIEDMAGMNMLCRYVRLLGAWRVGRWVGLGLSWSWIGKGTCRGLWSSRVWAVLDE
jgi:magnesium-transporting ATPase (P-type)